MIRKEKCRYFFAGILFLVLAAQSCKKEQAEVELWRGSDVASYFFEQGDSLRMLRLFYFVPRNADKTAPIVFVFHGADRNAMQYRNALVSLASQHQFIVVAPEFTELQFPGSNAFQLGNVFINGELPTPTTLLPQDQWTFSIFPHLFEFVKQRTPSEVAKFHSIGHSAGAQFLHRLLLFVPDLPVASAVLSASGWYTLPSDEFDFPYGVGITPIGVNEQRAFFNTRIIVQVGSGDNDPAAPLLRRNARVDLQGTNRLSRAIFFHDFSKSIALDQSYEFKWELIVAPGLDHSFSPAIQFAAKQLFD
ncbi:MAG: hypothetical protein EA358_09995 [Flavobacteriales bacterium]|nr:MAG: hypothetical protein EA358_09995 [Flavobacteriales bacterium]